MPDSGKSESASATAQIVMDAILAELDAGSIRPGERLVSSQIAARLGVSRAPVREALHTLAGRGIVELRRDREAILREFTVEDMIHVWEVNHAILNVGVTCAAEKLRKAPVAGAFADELGAIQDAARGDSIFSLFGTLDDFHRRVNAIGGNPLVNQVVGFTTIGFAHRNMAQYVQITEVGAKYADNYRRLSEAIRCGDVAGAQGIWRFHANWSIQMVLDYQARQAG